MFKVAVAASVGVMKALDVGHLAADGWSRGRRCVFLVHGRCLKEWVQINIITQ